MLRRFSTPHKAKPSKGGSSSNAGLNTSSNAGSNAFVYTPLHDVDEIRLLNIAPRHTPSGNSRLRDGIQHVFLSDSPLYTAVSWMWGSPVKLVDLDLDGHKLMVQRNLRGIIEQLRHDNQSRRVWIDAICIDQENILEKGHQVQMMGRIYQNANYVVACLSAARPKDSKHLSREAESLHKILREGRESTDTSSYRLIFGNRYFTRRWIIQEIALAKAVFFCCEGYELPMSTIRNAISKSKLRTKRGPAKRYLSFSAAESMAESRAIQLCSTEPLSQSANTSIETLLYSNEEAKCSNFHDKVYALISLDAEARDHLLVDYNLDRRGLMLSVLQFCQTYEKLSVYGTLGFVSFLRQHLEMKMDSLRDRILNLQRPSVMFTVCGTVRGRVESLHPGRYVEDAALRFRNQLPALIPYHGLSLNRGGPYSMSLEFDQDLVFAHPVRDGIAAMDQCLFAFIGNELRDVSSAEMIDDSDSLRTSVNPSGPLFAGLASTKIELGDEIWQFDRTPVAIVARKTRQGYELAGRAFLVSDLRAKRRSSQSRVEDEIVFVMDSTKHSQATPVISTGIQGLYQLALWVNFDD
jgi:hypothetical protein